MRLLRLFALLALLVSGCTAPAAAPAASAPPTSSAPAATASPIRSHYPITVTDDRGKALTLDHAPRRIVSLAPSATEIVFALGAEASLVALDDFSTYPAAAKGLPHIGGFRTDPEKVVSYSPDLVLTITGGNVPAQLDALGLPLFIFDESDIDGVYRDIDAVGAMLDRKSAAQKLVASMRARIDAVAERAKRSPTRPRVLHEVDSTDPSQIYVAGPHNFIDSMITIAGGINVAADSPVKYPKLSPEQIVARDPEVIVLADAAYGATPEAVRARPGWSAITAVKRGALYPIDEDIVSRPGPRLADGFEAYIRLVHPELFP
jgi:cobalamin transport system substrate-binding protein